MRQILLMVCVAYFLFAIDTDIEPDYEYGKALFNETCISCHGVDGNVNKQMNLIVMPRKLTKTILTYEQTYKVIKDGAHFWGAHADIMPAFKYVYNKEQLISIAYYVFKHFNPNIKEKIDKLYAKSDPIPKEKEAKMLKRGEKIYKRNCRWCHGLSGHGDGEATKNPVDSIFPYDLTKTMLDKKQLFLYIKYGGKYWGTYDDAMPGWQKKYSDYTIKSVVKYIQEVIQKGK